MPRKTSTPIEQHTLFKDSAEFPEGETLADVRAVIAGHRCGSCTDGSRFVFGEGKPGAKLILIGESPSHDDASTGHPFGGQTGETLDKIIAAIGYRRGDCYLTNVVKCPFRAGTKPDREDIEACIPLLFREIVAVGPKVIVAMGTTAAQTLLNVKDPISKVRGTFGEWRGIKVMPTFNPAYLLRVPERKREAWEDLKQVRDFLKTV